MELTLTKTEMEMCRLVGEERWRYARRTGRDPGLGPTKDARNAENDIRGAECEFAAAQMLNLGWRPTVGQLDALDVGGVCNVRSTILADGRLIVKPSDPDWVPFVLVVKQNCHFRLAGWLYGYEAKAFPETDAYGDLAHFVSQKDLRAVHHYLPLLWNEVRRAIATEFRK